MASLMANFETWFKAAFLVATVLFIVFRPFGINVSIPTSIASIAVFSLGIVPFADQFDIAANVSGPSITVLSIIMSIVTLLQLKPHQHISLSCVGCAGRYSFQRTERRRHFGKSDRAEMDWM